MARFEYKITCQADPTASTGWIVTFWGRPAEAGEAGRWQRYITLSALGSWEAEQRPGEALKVIARCLSRGTK